MCVVCGLPVLQALRPVALCCWFVVTGCGPFRWGGPNQQGCWPCRWNPGFRLFCPRGLSSVLRLLVPSICSWVAHHFGPLLRFAGGLGFGVLGRLPWLPHAHGGWYGHRDCHGLCQSHQGGVGPGLGWTSPSLVRSSAGRSWCVGTQFELQSDEQWGCSARKLLLSWLSGPLWCCPVVDEVAWSLSTMSVSSVAHRCNSCCMSFETWHATWLRRSWSQVAQMALFRSLSFPAALNRL